MAFTLAAYASPGAVSTPRLADPHVHVHSSSSFFVTTIFMKDFVFLQSSSYGPNEFGLHAPKTKFIRILIREFVHHLVLTVL